MSFLMIFGSLMLIGYDHKTNADGILLLIQSLLICISIIFIKFRNKLFFRFIFRLVIFLSLLVVALLFTFSPVPFPTVIYVVLIVILLSVFRNNL